MKNLKGSMLVFAMLAIVSSVQDAAAQSTQRPKSSVVGSKSSATNAKSVDGGVIAACAAAVEELEASRAAIAELERANDALASRLADAKRIESMLAELNETQRKEAEALRQTIAAKNETIAAKDAAIKAQDELIVKLERKRSSPWKRLGDILIGVGAGILLR